MMAEYQTSGVAFRIVPPGGRGWGDCPAIRCAPLWLHFRRHTGTRERPTLTIASASFGIFRILRSTWISRQYLLIFDDDGILRGDAAVVLVVVVSLSTSMGIAAVDDDDNNDDDDDDDDVPST